MPRGLPESCQHGFSPSCLPHTKFAFVVAAYDDGAVDTAYLSNGDPDVLHDFDTCLSVNEVAKSWDLSGRMPPSKTVYSVLVYENEWEREHILSKLHRNLIHGFGLLSGPQIKSLHQTLKTYLQGTKVRKSRLCLLYRIFCRTRSLRPLPPLASYTFNRAICICRTTASKNASFVLQLRGVLLRHPQLCLC